MLDLMMPPIVAALIILSIHAYLGLHVIGREVIFVDLAFAQIAALGSTVALLMGIELGTTLSLLFALGFTLLGALLFSVTRMERSVVPQEAIIAAAMDAPSMIHQVEAPAGSTLLFYESLIHAAGIIKSDKDRLLILAGYMPTMFQAWMDYDPDPDFAQTLSDEHRALITGEQKFHWPRNPRDLGVPAATV